MTVTGRKGGIERVTSPGYAVSVQRNAAPSKPVRVTAVQLTKVTKTLSAHSTAKPVPQEAKARGPVLAVTALPVARPRAPPKLPIPARTRRPPPPPHRAEVSPPSQCAGEAEICG
jgi:hypothetical protein